MTFGGTITQTTNDKQQLKPALEKLVSPADPGPPTESENASMYLQSQTNACHDERMNKGILNYYDGKSLLSETLTCRIV